MIQLTAGGARESGMYKTYTPIAAQEERCRPGIQIHRLRQLGVAIVGLPPSSTV